MFHTIFNVIAVILVLPLTNMLVALVTRMVKDDAPQGDAPRTFYIDDNFLSSPPIAVQQIHSEIEGMAGFAQRNFEAALAMVDSKDFSAMEEFEAMEREIDYLNRELSRFTSELFRGQLSATDSEYLGEALGTIADVKRVGDYSKRILVTAQNLSAEGEYFSPTALQEIKALGVLEGELFGQAIRAYEHDDEFEAVDAGLTALAITDQTAQVSAHHAKRISEGTCTPDAGVCFLALVSCIERVGAHFFRVAETVRA